MIVKGLRWLLYLGAPPDATLRQSSYYRAYVHLHIVGWVTIIIIVAVHVWLVMHV